MSDYKFELLDPYDESNYIPPRFASMEEWRKFQKTHDHSQFYQTETWNGNKVTYSKLKCANLDCGAEIGEEKTEIRERPFNIFK